MVGCAILGLLARQTVLEAKQRDEFVTVKGLSERELPADLALWPITFEVKSKDLPLLQEGIQSARTIVGSFLAEQGFEAVEISHAPPRIRDEAARNEDPEALRYRYEATVTVLLRTKKVMQMKKAMERSDVLVKQGVALNGDEGRAQYLFTGLNAVKPEMIQEANVNARKAAERFAGDSQARAGAIKHAVQGPFEVNDVDPSSPERKIVRVVTTVDFYVK
jgi:hypothetical protein